MKKAAESQNERLLNGQKEFFSTRKSTCVAYGNSVSLVKRELDVKGVNIMPKTIVVAFAGTGQDREGPDRDNPTLLIEFLDRADIDPERQVHRYVRGVGTEQSSKVGRLHEQAYGNTFPKKVREGYQHIAKLYEEGDKIILTGFSRGAATARSVAGMIRNVGIVKKAKASKRMIKKAYSVYVNHKEADNEEAVAFREANSHFDDVTIACLACFDTVLAWDAEGFHDLAISQKVEVFRHAISVDERRKDFDWVPAATDPRTTDSEQRLFPGVHSDVGGSYQHRGLSQEAHYWMLSEMTQCGLILPDEYLTNLAANIHPDYVSDAEESAFSDISSDNGEAIREAIDEQLLAERNALDKSHYPEKGFPFNWRGKIHRKFEYTRDVTIDPSLEQRERFREKDGQPVYKPKALPKKARRRIRRARREYEAIRAQHVAETNLPASEKTLHTRGAETSAAKSSDPNLSALFAERKRTVEKADFDEREYENKRPRLGQ